MGRLNETMLAPGRAPATPWIDGCSCATRAIRPVTRHCPQRCHRRPAQRRRRHCAFAGRRQVSAQVAIEPECDIATTRLYFGFSLRRQSRGRAAVQESQQRDHPRIVGHIRPSIAGELRLPQSELSLTDERFALHFVLPRFDIPSAQTEARPNTARLASSSHRLLRPGRSRPDV